MRKLLLLGLVLSSFIGFSQSNEATQYGYSTALKGASSNIPAKAGASDDAIIGGKPNYIGTYNVTGTTTYAVTGPSSITSLTSGLTNIKVKFANTNGGASTLNFNGTGAIALVKSASTALSASDIVVGKIYELSYDGTSFQIDISSGGGGGGITNSAANNVLMKSDGTNAISSGLTMNGQIMTGLTEFNGGFIVRGVSGATRSRFLEAEANSGSGNDVLYPLRLGAVSTVTPATGKGTGFELQTQTAASTYKVGATIESVSTDITTSSEDFDIVFKNMTAGAAATEKIRFTSLGQIGLGGSNFGTSGQVLTSGGSGAVSWTTVSGGGSGTVTTVTGTAPIVITSTPTTTPNVTITQSTTSTNGYLSSTDWNTFNGKQAAGSYFTVGNNLSEGTASTMRTNLGLTGTGYPKFSGSTPTFNSTIPNADLTNSSITIAGNSTSLGGSVTQDNITGLSSTGIVKRTAANTLAVAVSNTDYQAPITFGTGVLTALGVNIGSAGAFTTFNGAHGTPSSLTGTNITGLPVSTGISGLGTGIATALSINTGSAGAPILFNGAAGTPSSLALPNATGLPPTTGISGWPANASGSLTNNGSGTLTWAPPGQLGFSSTVTAAGTTTLTSTSNYYQYFTGTTIQTVQLPVVSTLVLGQSFEVTNLSTGTVTVNSSGGNTVVTLPAGSKAIVTCILLTGTSAASWNYFIDTPNPMTTQYDILYGGGLINGVAQPTRLANGTTGQFLTATAGAPPTWTTQSFSSTTANFNQNSFGGFVVTNSNTGTGASAGIQFNVVATGEGFIYSTPSNFSTAAFANSMVFQTASAAKGFNWAPGGVTKMFMDATNNYLKLSTRQLIGNTTVAPTATLHVIPNPVSSGWVPLLQLTGAAHTAMTSSTAFPEFQMDGITQTWNSGTIAIQPRAWIKSNTLAGTSGTNTATVTAGLQVDPWLVGSNAAITNNYTLYSNGVIGYPFTYTAAGTTGNQTINKPTGSLNIAALGTTVTLTNSLITANSIVFPVLMTNDATALSVKSAVVTAGQCVFTLNAAATAEVKIGFEVKN